MANETVIMSLRRFRSSRNLVVIIPPVGIQDPRRSLMSVMAPFLEVVSRSRESRYPPPPWRHWLVEAL
jgi:hypothetical protein